MLCLLLRYLFVIIIDLALVLVIAIAIFVNIIAVSIGIVIVTVVAIVGFQASRLGTRPTLPARRGPASPYSQGARHSFVIRSSRG